MKKQLGTVLLAGILAFGGTVCSSAAIGATAVREEKAYIFQYDKTEIPMNGEVSAIVRELGKEESYFEVPSCAFQGLDKTYGYPGFQISTYPLKGKDYVNLICILDETVSTPEGIKIGSTYEEMTAAYGKDYQEEQGAYRYTAGGTELTFYMDGRKKIDGIEYAAVTQ